MARYKQTPKTITNKYGVRLRKTEVTELRRMVNLLNTKNRQRQKRAMNLSPSQSFLDKPQDPFFNIDRKTQNLNMFKSKQDFNTYYKKLVRQSSKKYVQGRVETYRTNYIKVLEQNYNNTSFVNEIVTKIKNMKSSQFEVLVLSEQLPQIEFNYWGTDDLLDEINTVVS